MSKSDDSTRDTKPGPAGLTRREFLPLLGASTLAAVAPRAFADDGDHGDDHSQAPARFVYVGTYTAPDVPPGGTHPSTAVGIYVFRMDSNDGPST